VSVAAGSGIAEGVGNIIDFQEEDSGASVIYLSPDGKKGNVAHVRIIAEKGEIWLLDLYVPEHLRRSGLGRKLVEVVRAYAETNDLPVYTHGADPVADEFYVSVGCIWKSNREEFLVSPVSGERVDGQAIYRPGYDD
jgi:GNAT superfamily N-acetyltransferase